MERLAHEGVDWTNDQMSLLIAHHALMRRMPDARFRELTADESAGYATNSGSYKKQVVARRSNPNIDWEIACLETALADVAGSLAAGGKDS